MSEVFHCTCNRHMEFFTAWYC